jgi:hypothetical protein
MKERLTKKDKNGHIYINDRFSGSPYIDAKETLTRLCEYEDAEEAGLLIRLPCKVGDTVYLVIADEIFEWEVKSIEIFDFDTLLRLEKDPCGYMAEYISSFNDRLFITHEAAEKKLAELKAEKRLEKLKGEE